MRISFGMAFQFFTASANSRSAFLGSGEIPQHPVEVAGVVLEYAREHELIPLPQSSCFWSSASIVTATIGGEQLLKVYPLFLVLGVKGCHHHLGNLPSNGSDIHFFWNHLLPKHLKFAVIVVFDIS